MERKIDKQIEKLFKGNTSHWIRQDEGTGRCSRPFMSLCRPTQAPPWAPWSSFLSGRKAPLLRPSSASWDKYFCGVKRDRVGREKDSGELGREEGAVCLAPLSSHLAPPGVGPLFSLPRSFQGPGTQAQ